MTRIKKHWTEWTDEDYEHERYHDWLDKHGKKERSYRKCRQPLSEAKK